MPAWLLGIRSNVPQAARIALGMLPVVALLFIWWLLTRGEIQERSGPFVNLPNPVDVAKSLPDLLTRQVPNPALKDNPDLADEKLNMLGYYVWLSLRRVGLGFLLALAIALPGGILMGALGSARASCAPLVTASGYIPIATLVPLTMSIFGIGEEQKVAFLAMAFTIYLLPLVIKSIDSVPDVYLRTAYTMGASRWQLVYRVLVPVALPDIWHGMRLAFGVGWTYLVLTEVVVQEGGLGHIISIAQRRGPKEHIYLTIILIALIAWIADLLWDRLGRLLFPYQRARS